MSARKRKHRQSVAQQGGFRHCYPAGHWQTEPCGWVGTCIYSVARHFYK